MTAVRHYTSDAASSDLGRTGSAELLLRARPEDENRAIELLAGGTVRLVMGEILGQRGSIERRRCPCTIWPITLRPISGPDERAQLRILSRLYATLARRGGAKAGVP